MGVTWLGKRYTVKLKVASGFVPDVVKASAPLPGHVAFVGVTVNVKSASCPKHVTLMQKNSNKNSKYFFFIHRDDVVFAKYS